MSAPLSGISAPPPLPVNEPDEEAGRSLILRGVRLEVERIIKLGTTTNHQVSVVILRVDEEVRPRVGLVVRNNQLRIRHTTPSHVVRIVSRERLHRRVPNRQCSVNITSVVPDNERVRPHTDRITVLVHLCLSEIEDRRQTSDGECDVRRRTVRNGAAAVKQRVCRVNQRQVVDTTEEVSGEGIVEQCSSTILIRQTCSMGKPLCTLICLAVLVILNGTTCDNEARSKLTIDTHNLRTHLRIEVGDRLTITTLNQSIEPGHDSGLLLRLRCGAHPQEIIVLRLPLIVGVTEVSTKTRTEEQVECALYDHCILSRLVNKPVTAVPVRLPET